METMDVEIFVKFYQKAIDKDREEKIYIQWCAMLPQMSKYMAFNEFMDKVTGRNIDQRPTEVILQELEELKKERENGS